MLSTCWPHTLTCKAQPRASLLHHCLFYPCTLAVYCQCLLVPFYAEKQQKKKAKVWSCDHTTQVSTHPGTGLHSMKAKNNTQSGRNYWSYIIFEASWASCSTFFQRYSPPALVCFLLLLCPYIPAYTTHSPPHWQTHYVFAKSFCMFLFVFTLCELTNENITMLK